MTSLAHDAPHPGQHRRSTLLRRGLRALAVVLAALVALAVWLVDGPLLGHDLLAAMPGQEPSTLGAVEIVGLSLVAGALGWGLLAVLERATPHRAVWMWVLIAIVVLALSFAPLVVGSPWGVEASVRTKVVLALTHLVVAAILGPMLIATSRHSPTDRDGQG